MEKGKIMDKLMEIEKRADERFLDTVDWPDRFEALDEKDQAEYRKLYKQYYGHKFER